MKFPKRAKILLTALMLCALCAPVRAKGIFECGYSVEEIEKFLVWVYSADTSYSVIQQDEQTIVFEREINPDDVRYRMPKIRLRKRNPRDPYEPERWDYAPVYRAVERVWATFRLNPGRKSIETTLQDAIIANPDERGEVVIETDTADFRTLCRYCGAYLDGGYGSGTAADFYNGRMYVTDVLDGSAAAAAGIDAGDRIRTVNGKNANKISLKKFSKNYQWAEWGKPIAMDLERRSGERYHVEFEIGYIPAQTARLKEILDTEDVLPGASPDEVYYEAKRYGGKDAPEAEDTRSPAKSYAALPFSFDDAGVVTSVVPDSLAEAAGLQVGDAIIAYNFVNFSDMGAEKFRDTAAKRLDSGLSVFLDVMRDGKKVAVTLKYPD